VRREKVMKMCVMFSLEKLTDREVGVVGSIALKCVFQKWSRSSVVNIVTGLWTGPSGVRMPVEERDFYLLLKCPKLAVAPSPAFYLLLKCPKLAVPPPLPFIFS